MLGSATTPHADRSLALPGNPLRGYEAISAALSLHVALAAAGPTLGRVGELTVRQCVPGAGSGQFGTNLGTRL